MRAQGLNIRRVMGILRNLARVEQRETREGLPAHVRLPDFASLSPGYKKGLS